jgi:hypothetical protein
MIDNENGFAEASDLPQLINDGETTYELVIKQVHNRFGVTEHTTNFYKVGYYKKGFMNKLFEITHHNLGRALFNLRSRLMAHNLIGSFEKSIEKSELVLPESFNYNGVTLTLRGFSGFTPGTDGSSHNFYELRYDTDELETIFFVQDDTENLAKHKMIKLLKDRKLII